MAEPEASERPVWLLASHAEESDYSPLAGPMLAKLGYQVVAADQLEPGACPHLRLVAEERVAEVATAKEPLILLAEQRPGSVDPERVAGLVPRPAGLHELYGLIQLALEGHPRSVPRVSTALAATCRGDGHDWDATVLSLSENGCLIAAREIPPGESSFALRIELPGGDAIETPAAVTYRLGPDVGVVFDGSSVATRRRIAAYVDASLSARCA